MNAEERKDQQGRKKSGFSVAGYYATATNIKDSYDDNTANTITNTIVTTTLPLLLRLLQ